MGVFAKFFGNPLCDKCFLSVGCIEVDYLAHGWEVHGDLLDLVPFDEVLFH